MQYTLILDDLNCAHCASKIESKIAQTEGYRNVSFNFATKKLRSSTHTTITANTTNTTAVTTTTATAVNTNTSMNMSTRTVTATARAAY